MTAALRTPVAKMSEPQLEWFATAMVSMILADGSVSSDEAEALLQAISSVKDPQAVERLMKNVHYHASHAGALPRLGAGA
jgi:S-methylmethionine-dependent homocysteine/selenocysteine methylase